MKENAVMLITVVISTVGFSILFKLTPKKLLWAAIGGLLSCGVLLFARKLGCSIFLSNFIAAFAGTAYSELCAVLLRAPATVFLVPCNIPLVPGGGLYWSMNSLIVKNYEDFYMYATDTAVTGLGIACGVIAASVLVFSFKRLVQRIKNIINMRQKGKTEA